MHCKEAKKEVDKKTWKNGRLISNPNNRLQTAAYNQDGSCREKWRQAGDIHEMC